MAEVAGQEKTRRAGRSIFLADFTTGQAAGFCLREGYEKSLCDHIGSEILADLGTAFGRQPSGAICCAYDRYVDAGLVFCAGLGTGDFRGSGSVYRLYRNLGFCLCNFADGCQIHGRGRFAIGQAGHAHGALGVDLGGGAVVFAHVVCRPSA